MRSREPGRILDAPEILRLYKAGWTKRQIAEHFKVSTKSVAASLKDREWDDDPTLRARWEARLPAMRAAIRDEVLRDQAAA